MRLCLRLPLRRIAKLRRITARAHAMYSSIDIMLRTARIMRRTVRRATIIITIVGLSVIRLPLRVWPR